MPGCDAPASTCNVAGVAHARLSIVALPLKVTNSGGPVTLAHEPEPVPNVAVLANTAAPAPNRAVPLVEVTLSVPLAVCPGAAIRKRIPGVTESAVGGAMIVRDTGTSRVGLVGEARVTVPW